MTIENINTMYVLPSYRIPLTVELLSPIPCSINGISCSDYLTVNNSDRPNECIASATLRYVVKNSGVSCFDLEQVEIQLGDEEKQQLSLGNDGYFANFCPQDVHEFEANHTLDLCRLRRENSQLELFINNDIRATGALSISSFFIVPETKAPSPVPTTLLSEQPPRSPNRQNAPSEAPKILLPSKRPTLSANNVLKFKFKPDSCRNVNYKLKTKSHKRALKKRSDKNAGKGGFSKKTNFDCTDYAPVEATSKLVITNDLGSVIFDEIVKFEQQIEIKYSSEFDMVQGRIFNLEGGLCQSFSVDLLSGTNIESGDLFGSLQFVEHEFAQKSPVP